MKVTLPDGSVLETGDILRVSSIRDDGLHELSIDKSTLVFTVKLRCGETVPVPVYYHYSDWAQKKLEITKLRNSIVVHLDKHKESE